MLLPHLQLTFPPADDWANPDRVQYGTKSGIGAASTFNHLTDALLDVEATRLMYFRRLRTLADKYYAQGKLRQVCVLVSARGCMAASERQLAGAQRAPFVEVPCKWMCLLAFCSCKQATGSAALSQALLTVTLPTAAPYCPCSCAPSLWTAPGVASRALLHRTTRCGRRGMAPGATSRSPLSSSLSGPSSCCRYALGAGWSGHALSLQQFTVTGAEGY